MPYTNNNQKKNFTPKVANASIPLVVSGKDFKGNDYNYDSAMDLINKLIDFDVFGLINISVSMAKNKVFGITDAKGTIDVAVIKSIDIDGKNANLMFFGKNMHIAEELKDMVLVPRFRTNKEGTVLSVNKFEIVNAMDA